MAEETKVKAGGNEKDRKSQFKRYCERSLLVVISVILTAASLVTVMLYMKQENEFRTLQRRLDESLKSSKQRKMWTEKKINASEHSLRVYAELLNSSIDLRMRKFREDMPGERNGPFSNSSLSGIKKKVGFLILNIQKLSENLTSLNVSTDFNIARLQSVLKDTRDDLIRVQKDLSRLNSSFNAKLKRTSDSLFSSIGNLEINISNFTNFTASSISQLWEDVNETNDNIANIFRKMSHQNSSLHSKLRDTSGALSLAMKNIDKEFVSLRNSTGEDLSQLRQTLNNTRESLRLAHKEFAQWNSSLHSVMEEITRSVRSSIQNVNGKIESLRKDVESDNKDFASQQKAMNEALSKTKEEFQESKTKLTEDISGLEKKMMTKQENLERAQDTQHNEIFEVQKELRDLRDTINHLKNKATGPVRANILLTVIIAMVLSSFCFHN